MSETRYLRWICVQRISTFRWLGCGPKKRKKTSKSILKSELDDCDHNKQGDNLDFPQFLTPFNDNNSFQKSAQSNNIPVKKIIDDESENRPYLDLKESNLSFHYEQSQHDHTRPQHPLPEGKGDICVQDHYSIIFNIYGIGQTIEEYVLLFIMASDVEKPAQLPKFFTILDILDECCQEGYIEMEFNRLMKNLLKSYAKARKLTDENKRKQIMEYIFHNLRIIGEIKSWKSFHTDYLRKLRMSETRYLRWMSSTHCRFSLLWSRFEGNSKFKIYFNGLYCTVEIRR
ncbi:hypothetical protein G9A89_015915 [Geosiphon pyriformis]|nr:hypothetical protein G9A89_015915 [Geosiphon pyriformis]